MKTVFVGFDLMLPVLEALAGESTLIEIVTPPVDGVFETNTGVKAIASRLGVPLREGRLYPEDLERLCSLGCELLVSAGYPYRLPVTEAFPMVNLHPAPLPSHRGPWPMPLLLLEGARWGAMTAHRIREQFDSGEILLCERFPLSEGDTLESYMQKANDCAPRMVKALLSSLPSLFAAARPQGAGRYLEEPREEEMSVDFFMTAEEADRILRAFLGFPCFYRAQDGGVTSLLRARAVKNATSPFPLKDGAIICKGDVT